MKQTKHVFSKEERLRTAVHLLLDQVDYTEGVYMSNHANQLINKGWSLSWSHESQSRDRYERLDKRGENPIIVHTDLMNQKESLFR